MSRISISLLTKFRKSEIEMLFQTASLFFRSSFFVLLQAPATIAYGRLLLVIPKKIGTAPQRNKLRRRLKAIFFENKLFSCGKDIVFIAKSEQVKELSHEKLQRLLLKSFCSNQILSQR